MISYIENIIAPFVDARREDLGFDRSQAALAIFDHFKGQLTEKVTECLEQHNIQSVLVPANCTDRLQPLDISVNKAAKAFLHSQFETWYANELSQQISESTSKGEVEMVDMSTPRMKCIGGQWLVKLFDHLSNNPRVVINGFQAAHIPQSIDAGKPVLQVKKKDDRGNQDESSDDEYDEYGSSDDEYDEDESSDNEDDDEQD